MVEARLTQSLLTGEDLHVFGGGLDYRITLSFQPKFTLRNGTGFIRGGTGFQGLTPPYGAGFEGLP